LLARGLNSFKAACAGVKLHALAGKLAVEKAIHTRRISAEDIIACIGPSPE
jgi:NAD(P)H-hydrate repair Nnr-like enzyme with NAD(P)H-hydrate dehydratase domain